MPTDPKEDMHAMTVDEQGVIVAVRAVTPELCKAILDLLNRFTEIPEGGKSGYTKASALYITGLAAEQDKEMTALDKTLFEAFGWALRAYKKTNKVVVRDDEGYCAYRYDLEGGHAEHADSQGSDGRQLSAMLFLNHDFQGGNIRFPRQGVEYAPNAGDILIFPSNWVYRHESKPVTSGVKYVVQTYFRNTP